jgi:hypothetical protein
MTEFLTFVIISIVILGAIGIAGYFILRAVFMRGADHMAHHIDRALEQLATTIGTRAKRASSTAARVAMRDLTHLGAYAAAEGLTEEAARAEFSRSIERTARIMDSAIKLPIIGGVGLDAVLGLFPVAGDLVSSSVSIGLIAKSVRYGIPHHIVRKMLANVLVDLLFGAVPLVGDLADIWFRANDRNVALLKEYLGDEARDVTVDLTRPA